MNNTNPLANWEQSIERDINAPRVRKLGYFTDGLFQIVVQSDPSLFWTRNGNAYSKLKHKGRVSVPDNLTTKEAQNIKVRVGYDDDNEFCILGLWGSEERANVSHFGTQVIVPERVGTSVIIEGLLADIPTDNSLAPPTTGRLYYTTDTHQLFIDDGTTWNALILGSGSGVVYTEQLGILLANSSIETILVSYTGLGSPDFPAGVLAAAEMLEYQYIGKLSLIAVSPGDVTFRFQLGGFTILDTGAIAFDPALTGAIITLRLLMTIQADGASGTINSVLEIHVYGNTIPFLVFTDSQPVDTTGANGFVPFATFSVADPGNVLDSTSGATYLRTLEPS